MECPVKDGILYVHHLKFGKKTWRKVWAQLFADSPSGVARLEYFEGVAVEKASLRKSERKVIRLSDCVSVERAGEHSAPKDTAPFYLCMMERNILLAADQPDDWIECVCQLAFQRPSAPSNAAADTLSLKSQMEENVIYSSWQEAACEFPVAVYQTEASTRCHLKGNYLLVPLTEHLVLKDSQSGQTLYTWPYAFLRRFGQEKMVFSFEAGRRCDSGEGLFTFNTVQAAEIYRAVSAAIDHQKAILQETDKKAGILPSQTCVKKTEGWSWPTHMEILEGMQPPVYDIPNGNVEAGFPVALSNASNLFSSEIGNPDTSVIYASIGKSSPLLFQLWGEPEDKLQEQRGQLSDHLYENLRTLEQSSFGPESHVPSCRDSPEGSCNETSPIYDNSSAATKCSSSSPGPSLNAGTDSSPESQCQQHWLDYQRSESGGEGEALPRPKIRGTGAFKHKLVKLLSREGACKTTGKTTSPMDK